MLLDDIMAEMRNLKQKQIYSFKWLNLYGKADFERNAFVFYAKKAAGDVIRRNRPYAKNYLVPKLMQVIIKAIMRLWERPELYDYYAQRIEQLFQEVKHG